MCIYCAPRVCLICIIGNHMVIMVVSVTLPSPTKMFTHNYLVTFKMIIAHLSLLYLDIQQL